MKATVTIDLSTPQANLLLGYLKSLPYATVETTKGSPKKTTFEEAAAACNAVGVDEFFDELDRRIEKRFRNA